MLPDEKITITNKWPWTFQVDRNKYLKRKDWPKISIVTPSFSQCQFIEETILSVINQNYPNLEYIIIDGGSQDGTVEIIKKYESHLKYWISEIDKGQVDALIKGLKYCTGEIFNWINSDDLLAENSLFYIAENYLLNKNIKVIAGGCKHFTSNINEGETTLVRDLTFEGLISEKSYFQQPSQWLIIQNIQELKIDRSLHYSFDWGMILNLELQNDDIKYLPINTSYFREHVDAKTTKASLLFKYEKVKIAKDYLKKTRSLRKKLILNIYIFKLSKYLLVMKQLEKTGNNFFSFMNLGFSSPSLFLNRFYLGYLKAFFIEKKNQP